jgi:CRISPR/Cas system CSM-associated protein Csm2 small subunit
VLKDAFEKAGYKPGTGSCRQCGKPLANPKHEFCPECFSKRGHSRGEASAGSGRPRSWPEGYPSYFDQHGIVHEDYVLRHAEYVADWFADEKLTRNQLQAFYRHVRRLGDSLEHVGEFDRIHRELQKVEPIAYERAHKEKRIIPPVFYEFLKRNIDKCTDRKAFREGFIEHFQCVVAYCAGKLRDREGQ